MLVPKGKGVLDCLYFLLRYVKPNLDYFIQPIPIGSYDVFLYELSITGLITSLPAIQSAGEIKQGKVCVLLVNEQCHAHFNDLNEIWQYSPKCMSYCCRTIP